MPDTKGRKWFDVTVKVSYHHDYKVLAKDENDASDIVNDLLNCGSIEPEIDGNQSYDRELDVSEGEQPEDSDYYEREEQ